jgi:hypothetical protein
MYPPRGSIHHPRGSFHHPRGSIHQIIPMVGLSGRISGKLTCGHFHRR